MHERTRAGWPEMTAMHVFYRARVLLGAAAMTCRTRCVARWLARCCLRQLQLARKLGAAF